MIENEIFDEKCDVDVGCNPERKSNTEPISVSNDTGIENVSVKSRPVRNKKLPSRFEGFFYVLKSCSVMLIVSLSTLSSLYISIYILLY